MRVALCAPDPTEANGVAAYACAFEEALTARGIDVLRPFLDKNFDAANAADYFRHRDVNIVHFEMGGGRTREFLLAENLVQCGFGAKITMTVHDPERLVWRLDYLRRLTRIHPALQRALALLSSPLTLWRERRVAANIGRLITLTSAGAEVLRLRMRVPTPKVETIAHGSWQVPFVPVSIAPVRLLCFGYIYRGKGLEDLLHACAALLEQQPHYREHFHLTLAGGTNPDLNIRTGGSYIDELKALARELKIAEHIEFVTDLDDAAIAELIQTHSALILPYQQSRKLQLLGQLKGASGVLARAIGCGRGVITSTARALPEELARGIGLIYPAGDVDALKKAIESVLQKPQQLQQWSEAARALADERSWANTAARFKLVYETIAEV